MVEAPQDVRKILENVAESEGFTDSTFKFHERNRAEEGYMGDLYFVTIEDGQSKEKREVMVKKAKEEDIVRNNFPLEKIYSNECQFYETIWPTFQKFQESAQCGTLFNKIAKCYATDMEKGKEKLVLENLKKSDFRVMKKGVFFDKQHFEMIFREYGKFHGLSMAYKSKFPKSFQEISKNLYDYWSGLEDMKVLKNGITLALQECLEFIAAEPEKEMITKFEDNYVGKGTQGFLEVTKYEGKYPVITHGDTWSSNLMFKHDESGKAIDMRTVDFQLMKLGTVVFDLSYAMYSGGSKEIFDELKHYLDVYHKSLSSALKELQCDVEELYPRKELENEWKTYCKFGFLMGLLTLKENLVYENGNLDITEIIQRSEEMKEVEVGRYNKDEVHRKSVELIRHMYTSGFL
ncbi:uncharacterized protein [Leptinotarsa decemlineata]|uniref:uncharacterized protein n=1 Tax=Leptinotarsa decemlineata TaxID=7539 RepID=UPI000C2550E6|nr:uncharacterized protein LOC111505663 [Leptinotarsa decemlineata]